MTKLVSADGGDAGVAIVDTRPLKRIVQEISPASIFCETRWSAGKTRIALARW